MKKTKDIFPIEFQDLVKNAVQFSDAFYLDQKIKSENPFYVGFGNPNADILIVGQEKAIPAEKQPQIISESMENPYQWNKMINENIDDINYRFYEQGIFKNPLHPYDGKPKNGNTWNQYEKLIKGIYPELSELNINNSFLLKSFITEVNHEVSVNSIGNRRNIKRVNFTSHNYYKSFPVTILAVANYLTKDEIESLYDVKFEKDDSQSQRKLIVYWNKSQKRLLLHTRQMSNFFFNREMKEEYFQKITEEIENSAALIFASNKEQL